MNQELRDKLEPRQRLLVDAAKVLKENDRLYGPPSIVAKCAGELKRVFLGYALKSPRRVSAAEHEALDQAFTELARISCGPLVLEDLYARCATALAVAGEAAVMNQREDKDEANAEAATQAALDELAISNMEAALRETESDDRPSLRRPALWKPGNHDSDPKE